MNKLYGKYGWSTGAMLNISIGQGEILVTPIQMMAYTNLLATKGLARNLHIVSSEKQNEIVVSTISDRTWDIIHDSMHMVVNDKKGLENYRILIFLVLTFTVKQELLKILMEKRMHGILDLLIIMMVTWYL